jgi:hypothetical protein
VHDENKQIVVEFEWGDDSVQNLNSIIRESENSIEILFGPGEYLFHQALEINNKDGVFISGSKATWVFPDGAKVIAVLEQDVLVGDVELYVYDDEDLRSGQRYQVYKEDRSGDRLLEFEVKEVSDNTMILTKPVSFMQHVDEILEGSILLEEINFLRINDSKNVEIRDLVFDGKEIGDVRGHTIYSGLIAEKPYGDDLGDNEDENIVIDNCVFKNFKGRGITFYGFSGVSVVNSKFENILAEAIEIDHFSQGEVRGNYVSKSAVAIQLNDAYDSVVDSNELIDNGHGVFFVSHYEDPSVNTGNKVINNLIEGSSVAAIKLSDQSKNNEISENTLIKNEVYFAGNTSENEIFDNSLDIE